MQTVLPQGFELVEAKPDTVTFTLDRIVQKKIKAEFIVTGSTAPGTTVAHVEPSVETVTIEARSRTSRKSRASSAMSASRATAMTSSLRCH